MRLLETGVFAEGKETWGRAVLLLERTLVGGGTPCVSGTFPNRMGPMHLHVWSIESSPLDHWEEVLEEL